MYLRLALCSGSGQGIGALAITSSWKPSASSSHIDVPTQLACWWCGSQGEGVEHWASLAGTREPLEILELECGTGAGR